MIIEAKNELINFWHIEEKKKKKQALRPRIETKISAFGIEC